MLVLERVVFSLYFSRFFRDGAAAARAAQAAVDQIAQQNYTGFFGFKDVSPENPVKFVAIVFAESGHLAAIQSHDFDGTSVVSGSVVQWHYDKPVASVQQTKPSRKK